MSKRCNENTAYTTVVKKKDVIIEKLKENGYRITNQRLLILDIILKNDCSCCKEIYYQAAKKDHSVGIATVYRMVNTLEELGVINRRNLYQVQYENLDVSNVQGVYFVDEEKECVTDVTETMSKDWFWNIKMILKEQGLIEDEDVSIIIKKSRGNKKEADSYGYQLSNRSCCSGSSCSNHCQGREKYDKRAVS